MAIVPTKCTSCGGTLKTRAEDKTAICPYCGTEYLVQEAIEQYNITNVYNIEQANLTLDHRKLFNDRLEAAEKQLKFLHDYPRALQSYELLQDEMPEDPRIWRGKVEARSKNYDMIATVNNIFLQEQFLYDFTSDFDNAYTTADESDKVELYNKVMMLLHNCYEHIKSARELLHKAGTQRQKLFTRADGQEKFARLFRAIWAVSIPVYLVLNILPVIFILMEVLGDSQWENFFDYLLHSESGYVFVTFIIITLIPVIALMIIAIILYRSSKKNWKKHKQIAFDTDHAIVEDKEVLIPGYTSDDNYKMAVNMCDFHLNILVGYLKKYQKQK